MTQHWRLAYQEINKALNKVKRGHVLEKQLNKDKLHTFPKKLYYRNDVYYTYHAQDSSKPETAPVQDASLITETSDELISNQSKYIHLVIANEKRKSILPLSGRESCQYQNCDCIQIPSLFTNVLIQCTVGCYKRFHNYIKSNVVTDNCWTAVQEKHSIKLQSNCFSDGCNGKIDSIEHYIGYKLMSDEERLRNESGGFVFEHEQRYLSLNAMFKNDIDLDTNIDVCTNMANDVGKKLSKKNKNRKYKHVSTATVVISDDEKEDGDRAILLESEKIDIFDLGSLKEPPSAFILFKKDLLSKPENNLMRSRVVDAKWRALSRFKRRKYENKARILQLQWMRIQQKSNLEGDDIKEDKIIDRIVKIKKKSRKNTEEEKLEKKRILEERQKKITEMISRNPNIYDVAERAAKLKQRKNKHKNNVGTKKKKKKNVKIKNMSLSDLSNIASQWVDNTSPTAENIDDQNHSENEFVPYFNSKKTRMPELVSNAAAIIQSKNAQNWKNNIKKHAANVSKISQMVAIQKQLQLQQSVQSVHQLFHHQQQKLMLMRMDGYQRSISSSPMMNGAMLHNFRSLTPNPCSNQSAFIDNNMLHFMNNYPSKSVEGHLTDKNIIVSHTGDKYRKKKNETSDATVNTTVDNWSALKIHIMSNERIFNKILYSSEPTAYMLIPTKDICQQWSDKLEDFHQWCNEFGYCRFLPISIHNTVVNKYILLEFIFVSCSIVARDALQKKLHTKIDFIECKFGHAYFFQHSFVKLSDNVMMNGKEFISQEYFNPKKRVSANVAVADVRPWEACQLAFPSVSGGLMVGDIVYIVGQQPIILYVVYKLLNNESVQILTPENTVSNVFVSHIKCHVSVVDLLSNIEERFDIIADLSEDQINYLLISVVK